MKVTIAVRLLAGVGLAAMAAPAWSQVAPPSADAPPPMQDVVPPVQQSAPQSGAATPTSPEDTAGAPAGQGADIIVTAQKRAQRLQDVPESVTVATGAQLEREQVNTISDLSRIAPALEIQQAPGQSVGGGGQIRGVGTQSFQQGAVGSVGIVVDGVSQGNANISDLFDIDQVEVLKGPQGTLFGLTTSAGVINITTTPPKFGEFSGRVRSELSDAGTAGSEFGRQLVQGVVNIPLTDNAAIRIAGNVDLTQGVDRNTLDGRYDPHRTYGGRARLRWEPTNRLSINLIGDYTKVNDDGVDFFTLYRGDDATIPAGSPIFPPGVPSVTATAATCGVSPGAGNRSYCSVNPGYTHSQTYGGSVQVDYTAYPFTITSISSYRHQDSDQLLNIFRLDPLLDRTAIPPTPGQIIDGPKPYQSDLFTQELRFASPTGSTVEYTAGLFFSTLDQHNDPERVVVTIPLPFQAPLQVVTPGNNSDISDDSMAVFGQATIHLTDKLSAIAGGRYTAERLGVALQYNGMAEVTQRPKLNTDNFSWKLGGKYEFNRNLTAYATVARGYKGGQIALGDPTDPTAIPTIIRPEIPTDYEGGVKASTADGRLGIDVSGFYINIKDYQGQQCEPAAGGGINCLPENISGVKSRGVEANIFGRPFDRLTLNMGATWNRVTYPDGFTGQDGSDLGGAQLANAPVWKATASAEYTQPIGRFEGFLAGDAIYKSQLRLAASTNPLALYGDHVTLGGRVGIRSGDGAWSVGVFARNLTNQHEPVLRFLAFPDGTGGVGQILTTQAFRQVGLQLEARF